MYSVRQILKENWKPYLKVHNPTEYIKSTLIAIATSLVKFSA